MRPIEIGRRTKLAQRVRRSERDEAGYTGSPLDYPVFTEGGVPHHCGRQMFVHERASSAGEPTDVALGFERDVVVWQCMACDLLVDVTITRPVTP